MIHFAINKMTRFHVLCRFPDCFLGFGGDGDCGGNGGGGWWRGREFGALYSCLLLVVGCEKSSI